MPKVLITGTSSGIGLVTTVALAAHGFDVFATMRDINKKEPLVRTLTEAKCAERVRLLTLDLTDEASIGAAVSSVLAATDNKLDAVVHNAGVAVAGVLEDLPQPEIRRVFETNVFGVLSLTRALLPTFRAAGHGRIVIVSSEAAFAGQPLNGIYCATKWALEGWAELLAYELDPLGIDVVLIEPGPYRTEIWHSTPRIQPRESVYRAWTELVFRGADRHFANIAGDPKDVARVIVTALKVKRPRFRYPVGPIARLNHFLRGKIPTRMIRRGTSRYLGIPRTR